MRTTYPSSAGNRHTTIREKEWHLRLYLTPTFGKLRLDEIRKESIDRFYAKLSRDGLREKTRKNIGGTLRRILASAVEWEIIAAVPAFPKVKVPDGKSDFFNAEESALAIKAARNIEERALLLFAFRTGARAGEQIALEWGDIDWTNQKVIIRRSSTSGIVGPTKSGKDRKVPMTAELETALRQLKHLRGPRVFCNPDGKPMSIYQLHERLWGACRRAGLRRIRWHDCRHSFAVSS